MQGWIAEGQGFIQFEQCGLHDRLSHVTSPHRSLMGSTEDYNIPLELIDSYDEDEADAEEEYEDEDDNDDNDDDDDE